MAYMDFAQPMAEAGAQSRPSSIVQEDGSRFSRLEWQVVGLARRDRLSTLRAPNRWDRLRMLIFGHEPANTLADKRLEALRRLAVEAWHRGRDVAPSALAQAREAGFDFDQLEMLLATISAGRTAR